MIQRLSEEAREKSRKETLAEHDLTDGIWIFGYGSLMWNPDFPYLQKIPGLLKGYHRSFCVLAIVSRGTPENPGLSLGLKTGGQTQGILFQVAPGHLEEVTYALWKREMITGILMPKWCEVETESGVINSLVFIANTTHQQFVDFDIETSATCIKTAVGKNGPNIDYLVNTVEQLNLLGVVDTHLQELLKATLS